MMNVLFTDGQHYANEFVKELYMGGEAYLCATDKMKLFAARRQEYPTGSLIVIGLDSTFDYVTGISDGFMCAGIDTSQQGEQVIKMDTYGLFEGVDCYIVVDWSTPWINAINDGYCGDHFNGEIDFHAEIYMDKARNINNSPTIKQFLQQDALSQRIDTSIIPDCDLGDQPQWKDFETQYTYYVNTAAQLKDALMNPGNITINLLSDIHITETITIQKNIRINGNNFKIFEYAASGQEVGFKSGMKKKAFNNILKPDDGFTTNDGTLLQLMRSPVYRANNWYVIDPILHQMILICRDLPRSIPDQDNVFIHIRFSYQRKTGKVYEFLWPSIKFTIDDWDENTMKLFKVTAFPDFYFSNYNNGSGKGGVLVKDKHVYFPDIYQDIHHCTCTDVIFINKGQYQVEIDRLTVIGGTTSCIRNYATLKLTNSVITNPLCHGVINCGFSFIEGNEFFNITKNGVCSDRNYPNSTIPFLRMTNNIVRDMGHYGSNNYGVLSNGMSYIANNEFIDNNYGAIQIGIVSSSNIEGCRNLVEHNYIHFTSEWIVARKHLGLQDSGAIYIALNNEMAVVRYNRIVGVGGLDAASCLTGNDMRKNIGIYGDDGTYNAVIYGNIIQGTENSYDIDCRAEGLDERKVRPTDCHVSTNNFICFNFCDGFVRIQHHQDTDIADHGCVFKQNFVQCKVKRGNLDKNTVNKIYDYTSGEAIEIGGISTLSASSLADLLSKDRRYGATDVLTALK